MKAELSDLALFFAVLLKAGCAIGLIPSAIFVAIFVKCPFPFCVLRDSHHDNHDVRVPIESFPPFREQVQLFKSSGDGQLAEFIPASTSATSPSRIRRSA